MWDCSWQHQQRREWSDRHSSDSISKMFHLRLCWGSQVAALQVTMRALPEYSMIVQQTELLANPRLQTRTAFSRFLASPRVANQARQKPQDTVVPKFRCILSHVSPVSGGISVLAVRAAFEENKALWIERVFCKVRNVSCLNATATPSSNPDVRIWCSHCICRDRIVVLAPLLLLCRFDRYPLLRIHRLQHHRSLGHSWCRDRRICPPMLVCLLPWWLPLEVKFSVTSVVEWERAGL